MNPSSTTPVRAMGDEKESRLKNLAEDAGILLAFLFGALSLWTVLLFATVRGWCHDLRAEYRTFGPGTKLAIGVCIPFVSLVAYLFYLSTRWW